MRRRGSKELRKATLVNDRELARSRRPSYLWADAEAARSRLVAPKDRDWRLSPSTLMLPRAGRERQYLGRTPTRDYAQP